MSLYVSTGIVEKPRALNLAKLHLLYDVLEPARRTVGEIADG